MPDQPDAEGRGTDPREPGSAFAESWTAEAIVSSAPTASVSAVAYAELDSRPVAVAVGDATLSVWDLESGRPLARSQGSDPSALPPLEAHLLHVGATSSGGEPVAVTGDVGGRVQVWDLRTGEPLGKPLVSFGSRVKAVTASWDAAPGLVLFSQGAGATTSVYSTPVPDGGLQVWDIAERRSLRFLSHGGYTDSITVGEHAGRAIAAAAVTYANRPLIDPMESESRVVAWDVKSGEQLGGVLEPEKYDYVDSVAIGSVADRATVVGVTSGGLRVWDPVEGRATGHVPCPGKIQAVSWGRFGERPVVVAAGGDPRPGGRNWLRMWDPSDWRMIGETSTGNGVLSGCAPTPGGQVIIPWGKSIKVLRYVGGG
ncbi:MAG TPA: WD40 repeat domain-containing protein [Actinocrinis sp.]|nr:WD40 repeat domain-containing protein [Actinocrinis sp.]